MIIRPCHLSCFQNSAVKLLNNMDKCPRANKLQYPNPSTYIVANSVSKISHENCSYDSPQNVNHRRCKYIPYQSNAEYPIRGALSIGMLFLVDQIIRFELFRHSNKFVEVPMPKRLTRSTVAIKDAMITVWTWMRYE